MKNNNINNISETSKFIYGMMLKDGLPINNELAKEIEETANDYCIGKASIGEIIYRASRIYKSNRNFDYITYITYQLIGYGKNDRKHY